MRNRGLLLGSAILLLAPMRAANVQVIEEIVVKINGDIVTRSEYERGLRQVQAELPREGMTAQEHRAEQEERVKNMLRDLIDTDLLVQKGKELNLSVESDVIKRMDDMRRQYNIASMEEFEKMASESSGMPFEDLKDQLRNQLMTQKVISQEVGSRVNISKDEVARYYEEHKSEFVRPEEVHLREILISTEGKGPQEVPALEKKATDILARARKGERFPELAAQYSDNPASKMANGDIGLFKRGVLDKQIEEQVFGPNAKRGYITEVIKRPNGFLILKVEERHQAGQATLEQVEDEIESRLYGPKLQPALRAYLTKLRENAFIEIRPGYVDAGAAPGKDTTWKDPDQFKPAVTTKAEAAKKKGRFLGVIPRGGKSSDSGSSSSSPGPGSGTSTNPAPGPAKP